MQPACSTEEPTFADVLARETAHLQACFPDLADALSRAHAIIVEGRLFLEEDGKSAMVLGSDGHSYYHVNGHCPCKASTYHNEPCKHRLALRLYRMRSQGRICRLSALTEKPSP